MAMKNRKLANVLAFVLAVIVFVVGYAVISGAPPGARGALEWYSILIFLVLWSAIYVMLTGGSEM